MASRNAVTQDDLRRHNRARLLRRLHEGGAATRSDLVAFSGLNRSTVGVLVSELADAGLVREVPGSAGQVGRPSLVVRPTPESAVVTAFDLRVDRTVVALVGLGGEELWRKEQAHGRAHFTPAVAVRNLVSLTKQALKHAPGDAVWVGFGVAVPGTVEHQDGTVRLAPNLGWTDAPLGVLIRDALVQQFGFAPPVHVGNDADLGALAEHVRGVGAANRNLIYLSGEVGVGGGVIIDGRALVGAGGYGGEVGHMIVNPDGSQCRCGARGCWETEIGRDAIVKAAGLQVDTHDVADVIGACNDGDPKAAEAIHQAGEWLGIGLANLVNLLNPEVIVLGGHLRLLLPLVSATVYRRIHYALPRRGSRCASRYRRWRATAVCSGRPRRRSRTCSTTPWTCSSDPLMPPRPDLVHLASGDIELTIDPSLGARAVSWQVAGSELLARKSADPVEHGMYPMAPWAGRIRDNRFDFAGERHALPVTYGGWALHGTVLNRPAASVRIEGGDHPALVATFADHPGWPWPVSVEVAWRIVAEGVEADITVHALESSCPVVLGWHPWFRRQLDRGAPAQWALPATSRLVRGPDHLPTGEAVAFDPGDGPFDDAFVVPTGRASLRWPGALELDVESDGGWYVVYDEPTEALCVEPQNGPPDGLADARRPVAFGEVRVARPDAPVALRTRWTVRPSVG